MAFSIKHNIISNIKNIPGWRTSRKFLIIECDDWGGIRMPSKSAFSKMVSAGLKLNNGKYNKYDTLETRDDLMQLFDILESVRDQNNKPAVMTPVTNVANPDFGKIRAEGFTNYHFEKFTDTLNKYYPDSDVFKLWKEGSEAGIFVPELHGRDHTTAQIWMQKLKDGNKELLVAFDHGFVSLDIPGVPLPAREFRAEFYFTSEEQKPFLKNAIRDSVALFREIFGRLPRVFVPANGIFHPEFDEIAESLGIRFLYVNHSTPYPVNGGALKYRYFTTGKKGPGKLTYYTRNCAFEPSDTDYTGIDPTLKQVEAAFRWGKPANISTHRVNFAGGIDPANRAKGLTELKKLLKAILKKWPDVEFMSSGDALDYMRNSN